MRFIIIEDGNRRRPIWFKLIFQRSTNVLLSIGLLYVLILPEFLYFVNEKLYIYISCLKPKLLYHSFTAISFPCLPYHLYLFWSPIAKPF